MQRSQPGQSGTKFHEEKSHKESQKNTKNEKLTAIWNLIFVPKKLSSVKFFAPQKENDRL